MKRKNKLLYILTYIVIIIIFLVIIFFGKSITNIVFIDKFNKQPINNIRNIIEEPVDDDKNKDKDNNDSKKNNGKNNTQKTEEEHIIDPNDDSPLSYVYNEDQTQGNYIYLINQFPIKDEVGRKLAGEYKTFDFKLVFKKEALGAFYDITLEKTLKSDLENNWVKVYLESDSKALNESIRSTGRIKTFNDYSPYNNKNNEIILYQGTVTASDINKGYKDFTLRMWISEDVKVKNAEYTAKTIVAKVNVYAVGNY